MKGFRKYTAPFAPDQSGAVSVLYSLGGIIVVCDAGGCAGNICGFDEPRWFSEKSAIFSAGLRDMDAVFGRDKRLLEKLKAAVDKTEPGFAAIIGTPVPAVIGTDFNALKAEAENMLEIPVLCVNTNGMDLYDRGAEKAWLALADEFVFKQNAAEGSGFERKNKRRAAGVIGLTPMDMVCKDYAEMIRNSLMAEGYDDIYIYSLEGGLSDIKKMSEVSQNIVVSPQGIELAKQLKARFGTPYESKDPAAADILPDFEYENKSILVIHQQIEANSVRDELLKRGARAVKAATWFMKNDDLAEEGDVKLSEEDELEELVKKNKYDIIAADNAFKWAAIMCGADFVRINHFAVSGSME